MAADLLNAALQPHQQLTAPTAVFKRQKELTALVDTAGWQAQLATSMPTARALLLSAAEVGARALLAALPRNTCRLEPALFVSDLRQRLGLPDAAEDTWCPLCNSVLDRYSHHAALCSAGWGKEPAAPCSTGSHLPLGDARWHARRASSCLSVQKTLLWPDAAPQTCTCLASGALLPHLISPSRPLSGWRASRRPVKRPRLRRQLVPKPKLNICRRPEHALSRVFAFSPWLWNAQGHGIRLQPGFCGR